MHNGRMLVQCMQKWEGLVQCMQKWEGLVHQHLHLLVYSLALTPWRLPLSLALASSPPENGRGGTIELMKVGGVGAKGLMKVGGVGTRGLIKVGGGGTKGQ